MLFSTWNLCGSIAVTVVMSVFFTMVSVRQCGILQQLHYNGKKCLSWLRRKDNMFYNRLSMYAFLSLMLYLVIALCFLFVSDYADAVFMLAILPLILFSILDLLSEKSHALKVKTVFTARMKRLLAVELVLWLLVLFGITTGMNALAIAVDHVIFSAMRYLPVTLLPFCLPYAVLLANRLDVLYEKPHNAKFIRKAGQKLAAADVCKIGITGSYAKTGVKKILATVLSEKFRVIASPESFNTPMGIARCIHESDFTGADVFIAEMGARRVGDIRELCELVQPQYGIITAVCPQHIETFGDVESIRVTKGELLDYAKETVVAGDLVSMYPQGIPCADYKDVQSDICGTSFTLTLAGKEYRVQTVLLGEGSAKNVALAATLAMRMGMTAEEVLCGIAKIKPAEHRLEKIESNGITIIDDAYNANPEGAKNAIRLLSTASGRKVVVTPGLIELGVLSEEENAKLGERLVGLDLVIVVGDTLASVIRTGYKNAGGDESRFFLCPTLEEAKKKLHSLLQTGDTVLFLNDLPDAF